MILQLQNLAFETQSPSHFKLCLTLPGCACVVSFVGDCWLLFLDRHGHVKTDRFETRDLAIGMISQAFNAAELSI